MTRLKLNWLKIRGFKGAKPFELTLDGENAVITAENRRGKTRLYDAFLWLFIGKDSTGRTDSGKGKFGAWPQDRNNKLIPGAEVKVEAGISIDDNTHVFRKELHERKVKGHLEGYETKCWIDEVPILVGEYAKYIAEIISSERTFILLTDLQYFPEKLKDMERRKVLLDIAGEIGAPEGFDELLANLNGRTIDAYKKVLTEQKKRHKEEADEIPPGIKELLRGMEHPASDLEEQKKRRTELNTEIQQLKIKRQGLHGKETERAKKQNEVHLLKEKKVIREGELASDTSGIDSFLEEKSRIKDKVAKAEELAVTAENELNIATAKKTAADNEQASLMASLNSIRQEYKEAEEKPKESTCYACKQKLPEDKLALNEEKRQARLNEITARGNELKRKVDENKKLLVALDKNIKLLTEAFELAKVDLRIKQTKAEKRLAEIDEAIITRPRPKLEEDETWKKIVAEIAKVEAEIGPPVSEQLEAIESERTTKEAELNALNEELAQADRIIKDKARITELEALEKDLAQKIANIDRQLADIKQYKATESTMITNAVNDKFNVVEFKMFRELLNGDLEACCEVTYEGVSYDDMSKGERIYVGLDIANALSEYYGISAPLFIDNAESISLPIETDSQTIELFMQKGVKQLQVQTKSERKAKVA